MHFVLPANLRSEVAAYDPVLKPLYQAEKRAATKRASHPLGRPTGLLPTDLIDAESQLKMVDEINSVPAPDRFRAGCGHAGTWLIMHHDSIWLSMWFYNQDYAKRPDYIYGLHVAHKSAPSTLSRLGRMLLDSGFVVNDLDKMQQAKYGRTPFMIRTVLVTLDMIQAGLTRMPTTSLLNWGRQSYQKSEAAKQWRKLLAETIPTWDDADLFDRIAEKHSITKCVWGYTHVQEFSAQSIVQNTLNHEVRNLVNTPFFRRELLEAERKTIEAYNDPATRTRKQVRAKLSKFTHKMNRVAEMLRIYPDASVDYCQRIYNIAEYCALTKPTEAVQKWLRANMPPSSYVNILEKETESALELWASEPREKERASWGVSWEGPVNSLREWSDTINMMGTIAHYKPDDEQGLVLERPSRWRLTEFHDHVAAEAFKVGNPNEKLRQDLFPEPVRVDHLEQRWSFFQPQDVHQLASWGQAVRNCVGSASSYKEGIKKRTHFIVLAMIDGKPRFTIQATVRNGVLNVDQIKDVGNKILSEDQRNMYELVFGRALQIQDERFKQA